PFHFGIRRCARDELRSRRAGRDWCVRVDSRAAKSTIFAGGFFAVMSVAQALQIVSVEELFTVALVRLDVVDFSGRTHIAARNLSLLLKLKTDAAERFRSQDCRAQTFMPGF